MLELFGTRLTLTFAAIALVYLVWSTAPIWWSGAMAFRRDDITRRGTFVFTAVALIYGATALVFVLLGGLLKLHTVVDQLGHSPWSWTVKLGAWLIDLHPSGLGTALALSHLLLTWWITRMLATNWALLRTRSAISLKDPH